MIFRVAARCFLVTTFLTGAIAPAVADRAPSPEERARIESVLREQGFKSWGEIELDDNVWEVDDAVTADGSKYDLKLNSNDLSVIKREQD
jgi:Peptidase propeptide and YPEB domain